MNAFQNLEALNEEEAKRFLHERYSFDSMTDEEVIAWLIENEAIKSADEARKLPDGEWIILHQLTFTLSVCCGITKDTMFKYRWCFKDRAEAIEFFNTCENYDDIPAKRTSLVGHRYLTKPRLVEYDDLGYRKW